MLKLFRKIRRQLLRDGKLKNYLAYAIGEILLVVIGILIAIGINDYLKYQNDRVAEKQILGRIATDLKHDVTLMEEKIYSYEIQKNNINEILTALHDPEVALIEKARQINDPIDNHLNPRMEFRATTYREMENNNQIGLILNVNLREAIINHYNECEIFNLDAISYDEWVLTIHRNLDTKTQILKFSNFLAGYYENGVPRTTNSIKFLNEPSSKKFQLAENVTLANGYLAKEAIIDAGEMQKRPRRLSG